MQTIGELFAVIQQVALGQSLLSTIASFTNVYYGRPM